MKAISPVIATVIIVAVAIAISIAVALWITGLTSSFTGVEKLEVVNAYATLTNYATQDTIQDSYRIVWEVKITVKNTGTKTVTIDNIFVNNKPGEISSASIDKNPLKPGETGHITFYLPSTTTSNSAGDKQVLVKDLFSSGQTVSIVIHTASGGQYPATITLP